MSSNITPLDRVRATAEETHADLLAIVTDLLDAYYGEKPHANAFGCGYDAPNTEPDGRVIIKRADDDSVKFIARFHLDPEDPRGEDEAHWVYGHAGWMSPPELLDEREYLIQMVDDAIEREYLDEDHRDWFEEAFDRLADALQTTREETSLHDIADLFEAHETETLRTLLVSGDEEGRVVWQLLHSTDENGDVIDNEVEVPVVSEDHELMFVRAERYFYHEHREPDGKHYAYGAVIGIDDTDEVFFVHRLESDPDLRDPETEWTVGLVKEKMGFDMNLDEWVEAGKPHDVIVRAQGDLAFRRADYRSKVWEHYETAYENARQRLVSEQLPSGFRRDDTERTALQESIDEAFGDVDDLYVSSSSFRVSAHPDDTDALQELQDELDIAEETVRGEQERRGIQRLTAKRRGEIIEGIIRDRIVEWACEFDGASGEALQEEADDEATAAFDAEDTQVNLVLGNHTVVMGPAREHPNPQYVREHNCLAAVVVPNEATTLVWHDEHDNVDETAPQGVYEFQFLDGFEDAWWMN